MGFRIWLDKRQRSQLQPAWEKDFRSPVPTQMVSNGEFMPMPQSERQKRVEARLKEMAGTLGRKQGMDRREFLRSASGMAAAFLAMNEVFGDVFRVDPVEAADLQAAQARLASMKGQLVIDTQTHFIHSEYSWDPLNFLRDLARGNNSKKAAWNPAIVGEKPSLKQYMFENYVKEVFLDSDTAISLVSSFTSDTPSNMPLTNDQMVQGRNIVNAIAGTRRMMCHGLFWPGTPGWLEGMDRSIEMKVDAWKGYTVGDPLGPSAHPWRLDDEKLVYPGYEKALKAGIRNICIHKGLIPNDFKKSFKNWRYASVWDIAKAAKDFPDLNFIIYHSAMRPSWEYDAAEREMDKTGRAPWVTDLVEAVQKAGVSNVYGEIGSTFATTVVSYPRYTAFILGTLAKGLGVDHIVWGTDSVFYGSPQWQIEALRRLEIPADMRKKHGFAKLGAARGKVKNTILGFNQARLYGLKHTASGRLPAEYGRDGIARLKAEYEAAGPERDNLAFGYIRKVGTV